MNGAIRLKPRLEVVIETFEKHRHRIPVEDLTAFDDALETIRKLEARSKEKACPGCGEEFGRRDVRFCKPNCALR